jgi:hypothetical protein
MTGGRDPNAFFRGVDDTAGNLPPDGQAEPAAVPVLLDAGETEPIPPRQWLLGTTFCRRFLSSLLSPGGTGKTALRIAQAMSLAAGRSLTGEYVHQRCRVLYVTLEDSMDELRRRVRACRIHHGVDAAELSERMYLWAPPRGCKIAERPAYANGIVSGTLEAQLRSVIVEKGIDLVTIDPFVKSYGGDIDENSNSAIDAVCDIITQLAIELYFAADVTHHDSKGTRIAGDIDRGRGATAFRDAGRLGQSLTTMSAEEAKKFDISERDRRSLVRLDSAKVNLAPAGEARWFQLIGVALGNGNSDYPNGDIVQTVEPWMPPDTWAGLSHPALNDVLTDIDAGMSNGQRYSAAKSADKRAAWRVVQKHFPEKNEQQCREVIGTWVRNAVLCSEQYDDPIDRKARAGLFLNQAKRPS